LTQVVREATVQEAATVNRPAAALANRREREHLPKNSRRRMRKVRWWPHPRKAKRRLQRDS